MTIRRIGGPAPALPPIVIQRLPQKTLMAMSAAEIEAHLGEIYDISTVVFQYNEAARDILQIRMDIEAAAKRRTDKHRAAIGEEPHERASMGKHA